MILLINYVSEFWPFFSGGHLQFFESNDGHCNESSINYNIMFKEGHHAGTFQKETDINDMVSCIDKCCQTQDCDVAFMSRKNCYLVDCYSIDKCATKHLKRPKYETMLSFIARPRRNRPSKIQAYIPKLLLNSCFLLQIFTENAQKLSVA